jgi:outer membrane cobalamin receptor
LSATAAVSAITATIGYRVQNVLDEKYELIGQYPMPGREWGIDISLAYRL